MSFIWLIFLFAASCLGSKVRDYEGALDKAIKYARISDLFKPLDLQRFRDKNIVITKVLHVPPYTSYIRRIHTALPGKPVDLKFLFIIKEQEPGRSRELCNTTIHEFNLEGRFYYILPSLKKLKCQEHDEGGEAEVKQLQLGIAANGTHSSNPPAVALPKTTNLNAAKPQKIPAPTITVPRKVEASGNASPAISTATRKKVPGNAGPVTPPQKESGTASSTVIPKKVPGNAGPATPPQKESGSASSTVIPKKVPGNAGAATPPQKESGSASSTVMPPKKVPEHSGAAMASPQKVKSSKQKGPSPIPVVQSIRNATVARNNAPITNNVRQLKKDPSLAATLKNSPITNIAIQPKKDPSLAATLNNSPITNIAIQPKKDPSSAETLNNSPITNIAIQPKKDPSSAETLNNSPITNIAIQPKKDPSSAETQGKKSNATSISKPTKLKKLPSALHQGKNTAAAAAEPATAKEKSNAIAAAQQKPYPVLVERMQL